ncbi:MAG TPA: hypothetical protein VFH45_07030 [Acidimicrobiales bacterium]|nr:hypothetical protein [Acidimicrobiales bacterium]
MNLRHHYVVSSTDEGSDNGAERRAFHLFAEADEDFARRLSEAEGRGMKVVSSGYWRRHLAGADGSGQAVKLALDDIGITACDEALEGS